MSLSPPKMEELQGVFQKILSYSPSNLLNFVPPKELESELEKMLLNPNTSVKNLTEIVEFVLFHCVNTSHPHFVNQFYGAVNPVGLAGAYLVERMNTNQHTYEVAPVFVIAEKVILRQLRKLFYGSEDGDGVFCPGGSFGNFYALMTARHVKFPQMKKTGLSGLPPLVIFVSEDAHYSAIKMGNWMGLGEDNVVKVKTDHRGAMITMDLEKQITKCKSDGKTPLAVIATLGTTVLGAFDDLEETAAVCEKEGIWLHGDAAIGGAFIFSENLKSKWLRGIERCDSILWNAHKMLCAPLQCSVFITKRPNLLAPCNSVSAPYLFQSNKHYDEKYDDGGDKSVQCGRKSDAFKLWLMWVTLGKEYFRSVIEATEECAKYFADVIRNREGFLMFMDEHACTTVFFWYIPPRLRNQERNQEWWSEIGQIVVKIRTELLIQNKVMIGYSPLESKEVSNAFRLVLAAHPLKTHTDMDHIIQCIENVGLLQ